MENFRNTASFSEHFFIYFKLMLAEEVKDPELDIQMSTSMPIFTKPSDFHEK